MGNVEVAKSLFNGEPHGFKVSVPLPIAGVNVALQADATVRDQLDVLEKLLGKRILKAAGAAKRGGVDAPEKKLDDVVDELLARPLTPRRATGSWADGSLAHKLNEAHEESVSSTLSEWVDQNPELLALRYAFEKAFDSAIYDVQEDVRLVLSKRPAIVDYLIACSVRVVKVKDSPVVVNFVLTNALGAARVAGYVAVSAARVVVDKEQRKVPNLDDDDSAVVKDILDARLPLSAARFHSSLGKVLDKRVFDTSYEKLLEEAGFGALPVGVKAAVVAMMKSWQEPKIDKDNIKVLLPYFLSQVHALVESGEKPPVSTTDDEADYDLELFAEDETEGEQISTGAVKAAASLYAAMVLGDELDVFGAADYFTRSYLLRRSMEVKDEVLRTNLQRYVFSGRFEHHETKELLDRTRPAERQMFYRQVFNQGNAPIADGVVVNGEFPRLWKLLMLEAANYLERARESYDPDGYVSRQNVVQAVEDLQYNLSAFGGGLVQVVTPLIREELLFLKKRVFEHDEVVGQVLPGGGSWLQAIEALSADSKHVRPRAKVLAKKARFGSAIIRAIAKYVPGAFDNNKTFGQFIGLVDAYITTQSILQADAKERAGIADGPQESAVPEGSGGEDWRGTASAEAPEPAGMAARSARGGEWDF